MKRQVTRICKFEFCSVSMDTFAAVSAPYFISLEGCDCIKQNQWICHSIVGMSSTVHLPVAARVLCSVKFFTNLSLHLGNSVLVMILLVVVADAF